MPYWQVIGRDALAPLLDLTDQIVLVSGRISLERSHRWADFFTASFVFGHCVLIHRTLWIVSAWQSPKSRKAQDSKKSGICICKVHKAAHVSFDNNTTSFKLSMLVVVALLYLFLHWQWSKELSLLVTDRDETRELELPHSMRRASRTGDWQIYATDWITVPGRS